MKKFSLFFLGSLIFNAYAQLEVEAPFVPLSCLRSYINFSGGQSPYTLSVVAADTRNILDRFTVTQSPYLWSIPNAVNRQLLFSIQDSIGATAESPIFVVQSNPSFTCNTPFPGEVSPFSSGVASTLASSGSSESNGPSGPGTTPRATSGATSPGPSASVPLLSQPPATTRTGGAQVGSASSPSSTPRGSSIPLVVFIVPPIIVILIGICSFVALFIFLRKCRGGSVGITLSGGFGGRKSNQARANLEEAYAEPEPYTYTYATPKNPQFVGGFGPDVDSHVTESPEPSVFTPSTYPSSTYNTPLTFNPVPAPVPVTRPTQADPFVSAHPDHSAYDGAVISYSQPPPSYQAPSAV